MLKDRGFIMKRIIAAILTLITIFACCATLSGCGSKQSAKEKYGMDYYDRSDGKRIWYNTK
jgi:ABC-type uncharacterized transport system auxiliary subunit